MVDTNMPPLLVTEQAKDNLAKAIAKVIVSLHESGEYKELLERLKVDKAG